LERFATIGDINNPLRADVVNSVDIVALSYVDPAFINQQPSVSATGDKLESVSGAETTEGLKSVQNSVEELTQVDSAIFDEVSHYSIGADALYKPEIRLIDGILLPIEATAAGDE
jgi:hypothetical protein